MNGSDHLSTLLLRMKGPLPLMQCFPLASHSDFRGKASSAGFGPVPLPGGCCIILASLSSAETNVTHLLTASFLQPHRGPAS